MRYLILLGIFLLTGCKTLWIPVPQQEFPKGPPQNVQTPCPDLKLVEKQNPQFTDVLDVVVINYADYHACRVKTDAWIEWYNKARETYNKK